jgi:Ankyrin repeats (3 copies)
MLSSFVSMPAMNNNKKHKDISDKPENPAKRMKQNNIESFSSICSHCGYELLAQTDECPGCFTSSKDFCPGLFFGSSQEAKQAAKIGSRIIQYSVRNILFLNAIKKGDITAAKKLIKKDVNVNFRDQDGGTALIWAAYKGNTECLQLLVKHPEINVNAQDNNKNTALILAATKGNTECVHILLICGATQFKKAWKQAEDNKFEQITKCYYLLTSHIQSLQTQIKNAHIQSLQTQIKNAQYDVKNNRGKIEHKKQLIECLHNELPEKRQRLAIFNLTPILKHGLSSQIMNDIFVKDKFMDAIFIAVQKQNHIKKSIEQNDIQKLCTLLQTEYLFAENLQGILENTIITNPIITDIIQKRINVQNNQSLNEQEKESIFADYIKQHIQQ